MTAPSASSVALSLRNLSIKLPDGRQLLDGTGLNVHTGEFVLLVGPSGAGKSTLLRLMARIEPEDQTGLRIGGSCHFGNDGDNRNARQPVGLVFQNLALFDELSALANVEFAIEHARKNGLNANTRAGAAARTLLERLGVPLSVRLSRMSGGERRRVAVARTLAMNPPILLFDEPTTGLDRARARDVANLIAQTHREYGKTVIVVTHDYEPFLPFRPRMVLLSPRNLQLREVNEAQLREYFDAPHPQVTSTRHAKPAAGQTLSVLRSCMEAPGRALWTILCSVLAPFLAWRRPKWKLCYFWHYLRMVALGTTALYVVIAGVMLGFVFVTFSFSNIPYARVMVPLLAEEFLAATGYSMFRVVVPLMISVLIAGKCGAAAAADFGARRLTHQFEAMRNLGGSPEGYLYGNLVLAMALGAPLLTAVAFASSCFAALIAYLQAWAEGTTTVFARNFFATLWPAGRLLPIGSGWVLLKMVTAGMIVAGLAYDIGSRPKHSPVDVSRDVGRTIFWSSLAVLMLHALFSFVEF